MYSSKEGFDGQRASKGRVILIRRPGLDVEPAIITDVRPGDIIDARTVADGAPGVRTPETYEPRTAADVEDMPAGAWTWPPRA